MKQKGFINIALIVLVVVLAGVAGYFALVKKQEPVAQQTNTPTPSQSQPVTPTPTPSGEMANWKTYRNSKYGIEFQYPSDIQIKEQKSGPLWYQYNAVEVALQKTGQDTSLPFIALGIADDASIVAHKPPQCAEGEPCAFVPFEQAKLACEQFYKAKSPGTYDGTTTENFGREPFRYAVSLIDGQKACSENTWRFLGESASHKEVVFYGPNNTRFQFRAFLGYGVNRNAITNATDSNLKELEQQKVIYVGSYDTTQLMNKIISTFKFSQSSSQAGNSNSNLVIRNDWGISFAKLSNWNITNNASAQMELKQVSGEWKGDVMTIQYASGEKITDQSAKFGDITYWYDQSKSKWMRTGRTNELTGVTEPAVVEATPEFYVAGNMPVFVGTGRWLTYIISLSHISFLKLNITGSGYTQPLTDLVKTISKP